MNPWGRTFNKRAKGRTARKKGEMNRVEAEYSLYLEVQKRAGDIVDYLFEPFSIKLAKATFFQVDFLVIDRDSFVEFHDTKAARMIKRTNKKSGLVSKVEEGFCEDDAKVKIKVAAERFPWFRFVIAYKSEVTGQWVNDEYVVNEK